MAILFALIIAGCSPLPSGMEGNQTSIPAAPEVIPSEDISPTDRPGLTVPNGETEINPSLPIPAIPGFEAVIEIARDDLAQRLSISPPQIIFIEGKAVIWPDSSLGCPQPGIAYTQTEVPGYLLMFASGAREYEYHANLHGRVFLCEDPVPLITRTPTKTIP